jgi:hypothetical protein
LPQSTDSWRAVIAAAAAAAAVVVAVVVAGCWLLDHAAFGSTITGYHYVQLRLVRTVYKPLDKPWLLLLPHQQ